MQHSSTSFNLRCLAPVVLCLCPRSCLRTVQCRVCLSWLSSVYSTKSKVWDINLGQRAVSSANKLIFADVWCWRACEYPDFSPYTFCLLSFLLVVGSTVQSYPDLLSVCPSECVHVSRVCPCFLFACLLLAPDGMGSVSPGEKCKQQSTQKNI